MSKPSPKYHAHAYHVFQAENLLSEMLDAGLTPNVVTYTSLMVVLRRGGQPEKSIKILDLMKSKVMGDAKVFKENCIIPEADGKKAHRTRAAATPR